MKGKKYYILNALILIISIVLLGDSIIDNKIINLSWEELSICFTLFIVLNILKFLRLYVIFLEEKISIKNYIKLYVKTTFVNIVIPFKLGEIFRIYCFSKETKNVKKSIIGVLLDRFIDTIVLLVFLVPIEMMTNGQCSNITILLICFVMTILVFCLTEPSTYEYLNRFLIINNQTKASLRILKVIEFINDLYKTGKELIRGRAYILIILSILSWIIDYIIIQTITAINLQIVDISIFIEYLTSAVFKPSNIVLVHYSIITSIEFAIALFITYGLITIKGGIKK